MNHSQIFQSSIKHLDKGEYQLALSSLQPLINAGHVPAILYYGDILLDFKPNEGRTFLLNYAQKGLTEAYLRLAIFDVYFKNIEFKEEPLEYVKKAALQGNIQALFILLDAFWYTPQRDDFYETLVKMSPELEKDFKVFLERHNIHTNIQARSENVTHLNEDAGITVFDGVFSPVMCFYIITRFSSMMRPAEVVDPVSGKSIHHDIRTSQYCNVSSELVDWFTLRIDKTLSNLVGYALENGEPLSLLSYSTEQSYKNHFDALPRDPNTKQWLFDGEQRTATAICYLNNDFSGGETSFAHLDLSIKPKMGSVVYFKNIDESFTPIKQSYHAGEPVCEGVKWVATRWIRQLSTPYGRTVYKKQNKA